VRVLIVCTGNICRSPAAEYLLRRRVDDAALDVWVESAGTRATKGPGDPKMIKALARKDLDASDHRSRQVDQDMVERSDLVLATDQANMSVLAVNFEIERERLFILRELVRVGQAVGPCNAEQDVADWLNEVSSLRPPGLASASDDLPDPFGRRDRFHRKVVDDIDELAAEMVRLMWAPSSLGAPKSPKG
jgi:protein-tyrosine phosphatase